MNIPVINLPDTNEQLLFQVDKIVEEAKEVHETITDGESIDRILEESWDTIEATINLMMLVASPEQIQESNAAHIAKLISRGHEFNSRFNLSFEKI